jgi:hypothetical protein
MRQSRINHLIADLSHVMIDFEVHESNVMRNKSNATNRLSQFFEILRDLPASFPLAIRLVATNLIVL